MSLNLNSPIFKDESKARQHLEMQRWPDGPVCPHCGTIDDATRLEGKAHRPGLYQCNDCRKQFSVTVGTVFERTNRALKGIEGKRLTYRRADEAANA